MCNARRFVTHPTASIHGGFHDHQPRSGTNVHEIAAGIYRINTPVALPGVPDSFNFNQYLIVDEAPLLFHTGPRRLFPLVLEAVGR